MQTGWDLTEAAIQRGFLKYVFFKESRILKTTHVYIKFFKIAAGGKPAGSLKITPSEFFFKDFPMCFKISKHFKNIYFTKHLSVSAC